jgi:hypothetical protein
MECRFLQFIVRFPIAMQGAMATFNRGDVGKDPLRSYLRRVLSGSTAGFNSAIGKAMLP